MPEIRFQIEWPDSSQEVCYSPSFPVKDRQFNPTKIELISCTPNNGTNTSSFIVQE
jgi:hypothetical protein